MTNTEAIEILHGRKLTMSMGFLGDEKEFVKSVNEAINMAISALEKQEPKKPKIEPNEFCKWEGWNDYLCPSCGRPLISNVNGEWFCGKKQDFCDICGQRIDWSEE